MPFRDASTKLRDIVEAIEMVERFTAGMDFEAFREDPKTVAAVERKLQVISEAAIRLGSEIEARLPGVAWRDIRGMGNWLRHQYDRIDLETTWKTITHDLPPLKATVTRDLESTSPEGARPATQFHDINFAIPLHRGWIGMTT